MDGRKLDPFSYETGLTNCDDTYEQLSLPEQKKMSILDRCSIESKPKLGNDVTSFDFITVLPPEILEYILDYLSLVDVLVACHVSPQWNECIAMLDFHWRQRWMKLTNSKEALFQPKDNWKSECEQIVGHSLILAEDDTLCDTEDELHTSVGISAMDYCDGLLLCFQSVAISSAEMPVSDLSDRHQIPAQLACLYKSINESWEQVGTIKHLPQEDSPVSSCLLTAELIIAGRSNGFLSIWNMHVTSTGRYECSFLKAIPAHPGIVGSIGYISVCYDKDLNLLVSAGLDDLVKVWDCNDWSLLKSISFQGIRGASLLTGERSPFDGYHTIVIPVYDGVEYTTALVCWGGRIPLREAMCAHIVLDRSKDPDCGFVLMPQVFVDGGSLVYAAGHDPAFCWCDEDEVGESTCNLIWKAIVRSSFLTDANNGAISDEEIERFFNSLRPAREEFLPLPSQTECLVAVGKCFSVVLTNNPPQALLVVNDTGETGTLLTTRNEFGVFGMTFTMACTEWLDGSSFLKPGAAGFARSPFDDWLLVWKWKHQAIGDSPTLSKLLALRNSEPKQVLLDNWCSRVPGEKTAERKIDSRQLTRALL